MIDFRIADPRATSLCCRIRFPVIYGSTTRLRDGAFCLLLLGHGPTVPFRRDTASTLLRDFRSCVFRSCETPDPVRLTTDQGLADHTAHSAG